MNADTPPLFRILLLAATPFEVEATVLWLRQRALEEVANLLKFGSVEIEVLFTGVGPAATAYVLGNRFASAPRPNMVLQAGVAGAYHRDVPLGTVVQVTSECFADLGAGSADGAFLSLGDIGLHPGQPFDLGEMLRLPPLATATPFPAVTGATVSQTTGTLRRREELLKRWPDAEVETMEGAPFFRACLDHGIPPVQIRAISNYVETRDKETWQMKEAIDALNIALQSLLAGFLQQPVD
ncbi:futalosine hydrolase [Lewinella sp. 4G2]|uniref:futalosine hydrolase n=1 Tax=Lewinella sp. 4G2 TaxID=1803372 RepID=UPI0018D286C5|nr:futalosine hydrolase [Lewinella sp. 4G2]